MKRTRSAGLRAAAMVALGLGLGTGTAFAERACHVPLADWQPREALQKKLEGEGWSAISIRIDDGCYQVKAFDRLGHPVKVKVDPSSLAPLPRGHDGGRGETDD